MARPRRKIPPTPPEARGVRIADIPDALLPTPAPVSELVKVGEVCGYEVHARREVVERAEQLKANLGRDRNWPGDALLATIIALRVGARMSYREIAESLNMSERHVLRIARKGKKDALVEREIARLDREGLPMAVENVLEGLEEKDKDYTLEFMKGRGVFRQKHETIADPNAPAAVTGLVVQFVHDGNATEVKAGAIVANPNRALAPALTPAVVPAPLPAQES